MENDTQSEDATMPVESPSLARVKELGVQRDAARQELMQLFHVAQEAPAEVRGTLLPELDRAEAELERAESAWWKEAMRVAKSFSEIKYSPDNFQIPCRELSAAESADLSAVMSKALRDRPMQWQVMPTTREEMVAQSLVQVIPKDQLTNGGALFLSFAADPFITPEVCHRMRDLVAERLKAVAPDLLVMVSSIPLSEIALLGPEEKQQFLQALSSQVVSPEPDTGFEQQGFKYL